MSDKEQSKATAPEKPSVAEIAQRSDAAPQVAKYGEAKYGEAKYK